VRIIAPTTAPTLGNVLLLLGSWRWIYGFMAFGGVMMSVMVAIGLAESSRAKLAIIAARKASLADSVSVSGLKGTPPSGAVPAFANEPLATSTTASATASSTTAFARAPSRAPASPPRRSVLADYRMFLSDRLSLAYVLIAALTFSSHFSYVTGSLYVFVNILHVSTTAYGLLFGGTALFLMLGSLVSGQLSKHDVPGDLIIGVSLSVSAVSAFVMLILASTHFLNVPILTALLSTNTLCLGLLTPSAQQGAMENAGEYAGTASALMNAIMTGMGACFSYAEGMLLVWLHEIPAVVMSGLMLICCGCGTAVFFKVIRPASLARRH
jgi:DHA1 family bicyclomycin/chloramphenicol resistance-like MFS transporter